jgi:hypothetical protein
MPTRSNSRVSRTVVRANANPARIRGSSIVPRNPSHSPSALKPCYDDCNQQEGLNTDPAALLRDAVMRLHGERLPCTSAKDNGGMSRVEAMPTVGVDRVAAQDAAV